MVGEDDGGRRVGESFGRNGSGDCWGAAGELGRERRARKRTVDATDDTLSSLDLAGFGGFDKQAHVVPRAFGEGQRREELDGTGEMRKDGCLSHD